VQSLVLQVGVGSENDDPTPEKYTVAKPWERPRPTQDCSASKEEEKEEESASQEILCFMELVELVI
jgi:hypothetical protein